MAPGVSLITLATPPLPSPAWVSPGHSTVEPLPSVQMPPASLPTALLRNLVKFSVVPEPSERWTTVMLPESLASGLSALIAGSSHVLIWRWKILASTSADRLSSSTPERLYDTVIGAVTVGK